MCFAGQVVCLMIVFSEFMSLERNLKLGIGEIGLTFVLTAQTWLVELI